jgi:hypothetical protein
MSRNRMWGSLATHTRTWAWFVRKPQLPATESELCLRAYERKFANRPAVLEAVVRVHHRSLASRPATAKPSYQPMSASAMDASTVDSRGDPTKKAQP